MTEKSMRVAVNVATNVVNARDVAWMSANHQARKWAQENNADTVTIIQVGAEDGDPRVVVGGDCFLQFNFEIVLDEYDSVTV